jgi:hypothetical protein
MRFLERKDQSSSYVMTTAAWLKAKYPSSAASLLPRMRQLYRDKKREEGQ